MSTTRNDKRQASTPPEGERSSKTRASAKEARLNSYQRGYETLTDDLKCPITQELLFDPVQAKDGWYYERCAWLDFVNSNTNASNALVSSPMTKEMIDKSFVQCPQLRRVITHQIELGLIDADAVNAWKEAKRNEVIVKALRARAEAGDARAMGRLGFAYRDGTRGLRKDPVQAFFWFHKAAHLRDPPAATSCGVAYINGSGVERNDTRGISMITMAATLGSEHACSVLGWANECGHHGFDKNPNEATLWYDRMQKCVCRDSVDVYRERAANWLREHP